MVTSRKCLIATVVISPIIATADSDYILSRRYCAFDADTRTCYFTNENLSNGCVKAFRLAPDRTLELINSIPVVGVHPAFLAFCSSTKAVLCANYVSGDLTVFDTNHETGALVVAPSTTRLPRDSIEFPGPVPERQDSPHAHCLVPIPGTGGIALCADLGADRLYAIQTIDATVLGYSQMPPGSGPRHVALQRDPHQAQSFAYVSTELANTIIAVPIEEGFKLAPDPSCSLSVLPAAYAGPPTTAAHIELSNCGKFAFVGNRVGVDLDGSCSAAVEGGTEGSVSVIGLSPASASHLTLLHYVPIGGMVPRSFCVVDTWLVVGAQESSLLMSFAINQDSGELAPVNELEIESPGCVIIAR